MKQTLLYLSILLLGWLLPGCVKNEYDLSKVDTDNIAVGGELVMPLGKVRIDLTSLLPGISSVKVDLPGTFPTLSFDIDAGFDTGILDQLDESTPIYITAAVTNCISEPLLATITFSEDENREAAPVVLFDKAQIKSADQGTTTLTTSLSMEEFRRLAESCMINFDFFTIDKQPKNDVEIMTNATLQFVFSVQKSGGIKL